MPLQVQLETKALRAFILSSRWRVIARLKPSFS